MRCDCRGDVDRGRSAAVYAAEHNGAREKLEAAGDMLGVAVNTKQEWIAYQREMAEEYDED